MNHMTIGDPFPPDKLSESDYDNINEAIDNAIEALQDTLPFDFNVYPIANHMLEVLIEQAKQYKDDNGK